MLSVLPIVGDQVDGIRRLTGATAELGAAGSRSARRIDEALEGAGEPPGRVALLEVALEEIDTIDGTLDDIDLGDDDELVGPLATAHRDLHDALERAHVKLADGRELVGPVRDLLTGPTRMLLLAANNAEMAGGSGLALSAGMLTFEDGDIELGDVVPSGALRLDAGVELPGDLRQIYRPTGIGIDFRSATRSPNLPVMGPVIDEMASRLDPRALGGADIDGAIVVDAVALRDLLRLTGPVTVDGEEVDADSVLSKVLYENYLTFDTIEDRPERVSFQGDIAKAAFDALTERDIPAADLATVLVESSRGRHLMAWSDDEELQDVWSELDVAGDLDPRGLLVSFQNYSANKLDWFLRPTVDLEVDVLPSGDFRAHLTTRMPVPARKELGRVSAYTLGSSPELQGLFLTVHLPGEAYDISTPHPRGFRTKGEDGPMQVRTFLADVPLGTTFERRIDFTLPRSIRTMVLLPSARVAPVPYTVDRIGKVNDSQPRVISWVAAGTAPRSEPVPLAVRALVATGTLATVAALLVLLLGRRRASVGRWRPTDVAQVTATLALAAFGLAAVAALLLATPRV